MGDISLVRTSQIWLTVSLADLGQTRLRQCALDRRVLFSVNGNKKIGKAGKFSVEALSNN